MDFEVYMHDLMNLASKLRDNAFEVSVFEKKDEARGYLDAMIDGKTVGVGGSMTAKQLGIIETLVRHNTVYCTATSEDRAQMMKDAMTTDVYILSANAVSADKGEILNIDGTGNRVSSSLFGHKKVYFVVGRNKIAPDFHSALSRVRNEVAPKLAQLYGKNTPCALNGDRCYDCTCPDRICNALVVFYRKVKSMDMEVVLINEDLGL